MVDSSGLEPAIAETTAATTPVTADAKAGEETVGASATPAPETGAAPDKDKIQARFDKLTRDRFDALREAEYWKSRAQVVPETAKPQPVAPATVPSLEAYDFDQGKYQAALTQYVAEQARNEARTLVQTEQVERDKASKQQAFESKQSEFMRSKPDYAQKVFRQPHEGGPAISQEMAAMIQASEVGPEVAYYLAENVDKSYALAALGGTDLAREIGRIEARVEVAKQKPLAPKPVVSQAPPPTPRLEASEPAIEKEPSDMTDKEFAKWRQRQIAQRTGYRSV